PSASQSFASSRPSATFTSSASPRTTAFSSASIAPSSSSVSTAPQATPTGAGSLVKRNPASSDSDDKDSPPSDGEKGPGGARVRGVKGFVGAKRRGERKVFDREKLRPLSLPPRSPRPLAKPPIKVTDDIDESHPDLDAHRRHARVVPLTSALLRRARAQDESTIEFVPVAPKLATDSKRFIPSRLERAPTVPRRRAPTKQDQNDVTVTPVFALNPDSDDETSSGAINQVGAGM
ncbi:hypothetical protein FS749_016062, partial [Ceratobasidium sp. UAMH 11750]